MAYPISRILDYVLGDEVVSYDRKRLMELIKMSTRSEEGLAEELKIAVGAMEISDKTVSDVMTKIGVSIIQSDFKYWQNFLKIAAYFYLLEKDVSKKSLKNKGRLGKRFFLITFF